IFVWGEKDHPRRYPYTQVGTTGSGFFSNVTQRSGMVTYCDDEACTQRCASSPTDPNAQASDIFYVADNTASSALGPNGMSGGFLSLTGHVGSGILWGSVNRSGDAESNYVLGIVRAFNADTMVEIWNNQSDKYVWAKTAPPTVTGGKVFVPALQLTGGTD